MSLSAKVSHPLLSQSEYCDIPKLLECRRSFWLCPLSHHLQSATLNLRVSAWATGKPASVEHRSLAEHRCHHVLPAVSQFESFAVLHEPVSQSKISEFPRLYSAAQLRDVIVGQFKQH